MYFKHILAYCIMNSIGNNLLKAFPQVSPSPHKIPLPLYKTKNSLGNSLSAYNKNERQWHCSGGAEAGGGHTREQSAI